MSTSSGLFRRAEYGGINELAAQGESLQLDTLVLKGNRGGSELYAYETRRTVQVPAQLGATVNSVGVGDVFDATFLAYRSAGAEEAAWRASYASAAYAQTTEPDLLRAYADRDRTLSFTDLQLLGGTSLPWEARPQHQIYLAAPDFSYRDTRSIERAVSALEYHNFKIRRPVKENGEIPCESSYGVVSAAYQKDIELMRKCRLVFAVPTSRDPGALVEVGWALARGIPVIVYDPERECSNTMVIAGSYCYSADLDECLNATFRALSRAKLDSQ